MAKAPSDIRSLARRHTETALKTLLSIASCPKANDSARVSAAIALLDRGWGKAKETVELKGDPFAAMWGAIQGRSQVAPEDDDHRGTTH